MLGHCLGTCELSSTDQALALAAIGSQVGRRPGNAHLSAECAWLTLDSHASTQSQAPISAESEGWQSRQPCQLGKPCRSVIDCEMRRPELLAGSCLRATLHCLPHPTEPTLDPETLNPAGRLCGHEQQPADACQCASTGTEVHTLVGHQLGSLPDCAGALHRCQIRVQVGISSMSLGMVGPVPAVHADAPPCI